MPKQPLIMEILPQQDKMELVGSSRGQAHPIYNLAGRHWLSNFRGSVVSNRLPIEEWLETNEDVMKIYTMIDANKI